MRTQEPPTLARDRDRRQVEAAILLVADGRYPSVVIANLADADPIARALCATASRAGVALSTTRRFVDGGADIVIRRR
jgi:hypothetical protein